MAKPAVYKGDAYFGIDCNFFINREEEAVKSKHIYHSHDFVEICYVCAGTGYHMVDGKEYMVSKGALFIINRDIPHAFYRDAGESLMTYNLLFTPSFLDENLIDFDDFNSLTLSYLFKNIWDENVLGEGFSLSLEEQNDFDLLIGNIFQEYTLKQSGCNAMIRGYLIQLITRILRHFHQRSLQGSAPSGKKAAIQNALDHLREHYNETISLNELAMKSFFSRSYFCRLFKEATGTNVSQYVNGIRIDEACRLLRTDKKAAQIALEVGFSDYKAFHQTFKKLTGLSPSEYKKRLHTPSIRPNRANPHTSEFPGQLRS